MERTRGSFIRDLIVKIFLILLFVFLITLLFPMPNLTPFYNRIFNDNVQTMKDAAEDYFTKDRMPTKVGDSSKLTLQQMLDKKLVLPFLDKDGKECDTNKSYVKVTKKKTEYELEVHLTCGNESDYIIEPIGCYNFCPDNSCTKEITTDTNTGKVTLNVDRTTPKTPTGNDKYKLQYLYTRTLTSEKWNTGDWTTTKRTETNDVKLVDKKVQYTGQKKVAKGTTTYKHVKYGYRDNWTYDTNWTDEVKTITDRVKLADTRTLYTGKKKVTNTTNTYKHIKYGYRDKWTTDTNWTFDVKTQTDKVKLADTRTLYTGQKKTTVDTTKYKHVKYGYRDNWKETGYQTTKYNTNDSVVLLGTRYTVRKTTNTTTGGWSGWVKDTTWRTSKPANTSTTQWSDAYNSRTTVTGTDKKLLYNTYESTTPLTSTSTRWYEFLYYDDVPCKTACTSSTIRVYYYRVYEVGNTTTTEYQYMYRTYSSDSTTNTDEKVVTDPTPYTNDGYAIVKYEYNYKINTKEKYVIDTVWTDSQNSPAGYEYANEKKITRTTKYVNLNKWVTTPGALGEYTYNQTTRKQYKYKYNNPEKYVIDTVWTNSINPPSGYTYTGENKTDVKTSYIDLGRWVTTPGELGEYTYNQTTKKQYKYKYNNPERYIKDTIWTDSINPPAGYTYTGEHKTTDSTTYIDLGRWVDNKSELGEYTHNIQTRTLYKYKVRTTTTTTESRWFDTNPGGNWVYANQTRKIKVN